MPEEKSSKLRQDLMKILEKAKKKPENNFCQKLFKLAKDQGLSPLLVAGKTGIQKDFAFEAPQLGFFSVVFESAQVWIYLASK